MPLLKVSDQLLQKARTDIDTALRELESRLSGLSAAEVEVRARTRVIRH